MRLATLGAVLLLLGGGAIATGILPLPDAAAVAERVWPVLLFAVAITVVAGLASDAGVFTAVAELTARIARGRAWLLWLLVVLLAIVSTAFLSLDTTAVLLTPVVVLTARRHGLPPLPFALTTVWLANTASLLLPVSNLTNLLALHTLGFADPLRFLALLIVPALIATGVLVQLAGSGETPGDLLRLSLSGMLGANAVDNLPAYLALEPVAGSPVRLAALLIGVNAGPLITPWASLATLLWHSRLRALGVEVRWSRYLLLGVVVAPLTVVPATLGLALTV